MPTRQCSMCKQYKPLTGFSKNTKSKDGLQSRCKECNRVSARDWAREHPEGAMAWKTDHPELTQQTQRISKRKGTLRNYNLTAEDYDLLFRAQDGRCAICGTSDPGKGIQHFHIDHDHSCCPGNSSCGKCVRGLLCVKCNMGIGMFNDDPDLLLIAVCYVMPLAVI